MKKGEKKAKSIKFSVLMSVYHKEKPEYLDLSLNSVFNQTVMPNEVVLVEDGKLTEELDKVINNYEKKYAKILKVIKFKENRGLGIALHDGLLNCSNEYVARMDTDDYAVKDRFEKELNILREKDVDIVGSNILEFDENMEKELCKRIVPENDFDIKKTAKNRNPINHMTVIYKKSLVTKAGSYQDMPYFEDYYLWARMIKNNYKFYNIQDVLVNVRGGNEMIKRRGGRKYVKSIIKFEKALYSLKIINKREYIFNVFERIIVSIIPNKMRFFIYKQILRK